MKEFFDILLSDEVACELDNLLAIGSVMIVVAYLFFG